MALTIGLASAAVRGDDAPPAKVDNPMYTAWAKFEVGATSSYEGDFPAGDDKTVHATDTDTLKEKTADSVKVESAGQVGDQKQDPSTDTYPAKVDPADAKLTGEEEVKNGDKTYKCKVYEIGPTAVGDPKAPRMKVWISDEVPGGVVKAVIPGPGGKDIDMKMTSFKAK